MKNIGKPILVLHIGAGKCGSTALQHFLALNRRGLRAKGLLVLDDLLGLRGPFTGNQIYFFEEMMREPRVAQAVVAERLMSSLASREADGIRYVLISAENLSNPGPGYHFFELLQELFEMRIIFYIRRQDEFLASAWKQWGVKLSSDFWAGVVDALTYAGRWHRVLEPWARTYGKEAITARVYDRALFPQGDVVADFLSILDISAAGLDIRPREYNSSYDHAATSLIQGVRGMLRDHTDDEFEEMLRCWAGECQENKNEEFLFTKPQSEAIMRAYAEENERVRDEYFPKLRDAPLFSESRTGKFPAAEGDLVQQRIDLLARLVFSSYREIQRLKGLDGRQ